MAIHVGEGPWAEVLIVEGIFYHVPDVWLGGCWIAPPICLGCGLDTKAVHEGSLLFRDVGDGVEKTLEGSRPRLLQG